MCDPNHSSGWKSTGIHTNDAESGKVEPVTKHQLDAPYRGVSRNWVTHYILHWSSDTHLYKALQQQTLVSITFAE